MKTQHVSYLVLVTFVAATTSQIRHDHDIRAGIDLPPATTSNDILASCPYQLVVLGLHGSRTSVITRLLTLLGHYAGTRDEVEVSPKEPLKWWELKETQLADMHFLRNITHANFYSWIGIGYSGYFFRDDSSVVEDLHTGFERGVHQLNKHCPWVVKDPRLCWTAGMCVAGCIVSV